MEQPIQSSDSDGMSGSSELYTSVPLLQSSPGDAEDTSYSVKSNTDKDQPDVEELKKENAELLDKIAKLCVQRDENEVENILLLGTPGAGKSSLVNTVIKAVAGEYIPAAAVGSGTTGSKTLTLERFQSCGVTEKNIVVSQNEIVYTILPKLPNIFDAAGMVDQGNSEGVEEILELLIGGFIPPNTAIHFLQDLQEKHKIGCLQNKIYKKSKREWRMTKVLFVQSCEAERIPEELIRCLDRILRKVNPRTFQPKYRVDVFVVITKCDLVKESDHPSDGYVSRKRLKEIEVSLAKGLSIVGATHDKIIHWTSYSDRIVPDSPYIDNIALKFLKRMMISTKKTEQEETIITPWQLWKLNVTTKLNETKEKAVGPYAFICVLMIIVATLLYTLLSAKPV